MRVEDECLDEVCFVHRCRDRERQRTSSTVLKVTLEHTLEGGVDTKVKLQSGQDHVQSQGQAQLCLGYW